MVCSIVSYHLELYIKDNLNIFSFEHLVEDGRLNGGNMKILKQVSKPLDLSCCGS